MNMRNIDVDTSSHASRTDLEAHFHSTEDANTVDDNNQQPAAPIAGSDNSMPVSNEGTDEYCEQLQKLADYCRLQARRAERLAEYSHLPVSTQQWLVSAYGSLGQVAEHDIRNSDRANAAVSIDGRATAHSSYCISNHNTMEHLVLQRVPMDKDHLVPHTPHHH